MREYLASGKGACFKKIEKKCEVFISGPEQSGQSLSRRNPLLSSAKYIIYLLQKADGLQVITMYWAGELNVHANVGDSPAGLRGRGRGRFLPWSSDKAFLLLHHHSCSSVLLLMVWQRKAFLLWKGLCPRQRKEEQE